MEQKNRDEIVLSDIAFSILKKRYLKKNESGETIEEPIDLFRRVARTIADGEYQFDAYEEGTADEWYRKFLNLMLSRKFMPNSPTLMNAGRELGQLSACFVLPIEDDLTAIYDTLKHQALIHQTGGGTGFSFSRLRPKNDIVKSTMGVASGPVSFLTVFDASTEQIKQGGTRRGANMGILRVDHEDIEEFIDCKRDNDKINNFNISVGITDEFMDAVMQRQNGYDRLFGLRNPRNGEYMRYVDPLELWNKICQGAWLNGEPGVVFLDKMNERNPTPQFPIEATNPCSEAHLPPYDVCNLGSINVAEFVKTEPVEFLASGGQFSERSLDWDDLGEAVHIAVRFLDNVIEVNKYPLPEIEEMSKGNRRIGLGVMGFADLLIKLGIRYDSRDGFEFGYKLMKFLEDEARKASSELAKERGNFPNYEESIFGQRDFDTPWSGLPMRNATVSTIAPTGTISMIAGCSGGIEPLFALAFKRRQADMEMNDVNPEFERRIRDHYRSESVIQKILDQVAEEGDLASFEENELPSNMKEVFRTAGQMFPEAHIRMQAEFQKNTSMGISKTINLPHTATVSDVRAAYELAYAMGCTGTAVYRDGSRDEQVLSTGKTIKVVAAGGLKAEGVHESKLNSTGSQSPENASDALESQGRGSTPLTLAQARNGRPRTLSGVTKKITTGHGPMYVTMNDDEFGARECFANLGKAGGTATAFTEALGRMISLAMTQGATPNEVVHQLRGIQDGHPVGFGPNAVLSVPDAIARVMSEHYLIEEEEASVPLAAACPECSGNLVEQEGCILCHSCGYSKCG